MRFILLLLLPLYLFSYSKVALVIGNSNYAEGKLSLPTKDATKISQFLTQKGFKVYTHKNLTKSSMKRAIKAIKSKVSKGGTALFYYSGHGIEVEGENYLLPINNSGIEDESDLEDRAISLTYIIRKLQLSPSKINIVMVDACRNNPLSFNKGSKGLVSVSDDKLKDTFLVFAGATKQTIPDDGLFRQQFIKYANQPLSLGDLFSKIRREFRDQGRNGIYTRDRTVEIFKFSGRSEPYEEESRVVEAKSKWISPTERQCKNGHIDGGVCEANWKNAKKICSALGGRLPSIEELRAEVIKCGGTIDDDKNNRENSSYQACYKNNGFTWYWYWSNTTYTPNSSNAWIVRVDNGSDDKNGKGNDNFVRCVRAGQ